MNENHIGDIWMLFKEYVDKKVLDGRLRLVLLKGLGGAVVTSDFPCEVLDATLRADYRALVAQL